MRSAVCAAAACCGGGHEAGRLNPVRAHAIRALSARAPARCERRVRAVVRTMLEEEVVACKQLPAGPPQHVGPAGGKDAALGEAPAPLTYCPVRRASASAARSLQLTSNTSTHNADRAVRARGARRHDKKPLNTTCSKLVGKWLLLHTCSALRRCKCVGASCSYPTAANRSSELTNGFAIKT